MIIPVLCKEKTSVWWRDGVRTGVAGNVECVYVTPNSSSNDTVHQAQGILGGAVRQVLKKINNDIISAKIQPLT